MDYSKGTYKIQLTHGCLNVALQIALFRDGCEWRHDGDQVLELCNGSAIFINNGVMYKGGFHDYVNSHYKSISWKDAVKTHLVKSPKKLDAYGIF